MIPRLALLVDRRHGYRLTPLPLGAVMRVRKKLVQHAWTGWQRRAGFDRVYGFHCLRHSAISSVYAMTHDLFLAQRFARHASPLTTVVYTHPSDEEMSGRLRRLSC